MSGVQGRQPPPGRGAKRAIAEIDNPRQTRYTARQLNIAHQEGWRDRPDETPATPALGWGIRD